MLRPAGYSQVNWQGHFKGSVYGASEQYDYVSAFSELSLKPSYRMGFAYLFADVRMRTGLRYDNYVTDMELKEAYAAFQGENIELSLGNQIIPWGRADGINPTNSLVRSDYFLLTADLDDQKLGTFMGSFIFRLTPEIELQLIGIPFYSPSVYRYDLFEFGENANFGVASMPEKTFENGSIAGRLNVDLPAFGFAVSGFYGYDPFYGFTISQIDFTTASPEIIYSATPYRKTSLGADFAFPVGSWIIRGEIAWNQTENEDQEMHIPDPNLHYVAGLEKRIGGVTTIVQYLGKYNLSYTTLQEPQLTDPGNPQALMAYANDIIFWESAKHNRSVFGLTEELNHGFMLSLQKSIAYDLVTVELTGLYQLTTQEYMLRPKLDFRLSDGLNLAVGGQYLAGPDGSLFDYAGKMLSGAFVEIVARF